MAESLTEHMRTHTDKHIRKKVKSPDEYSGKTEWTAPTLICYPKYLAS